MNSRRFNRSECICSLPATGRIAGYRIRRNQSAGISRAAFTILDCCDAHSTSELGQNLRLPQRNIGIRFNPISRHYAHKMAAVPLPDFVADASRNGDEANLCLPRAETNESGLQLLGPGQSDFGRIDISTVKDALGSMHWDVDDCPVSMHLDEPAAVDGPYQTGAAGIVERPLGRTTEQPLRVLVRPPYCRD